MSRYLLEDGTVVDTAHASAEFTEDTYFDGSNHISRATGSQWVHETLYQSASGKRWYIETVTQIQSGRDHARLVDARDAAKWILLNHGAMPEELASVADEILD